jgi:hypothetical protein
MGGTPFSGVTAPKSVTVRRPAGSAAAYAAWENSFTGGNSNITVTYVGY